jgi:hypothetical protein
MIRFVLCFLILIGSSAMAKDGGILAPDPTAPIDAEEQFWNSAEGQDIQRLFEEFRTGKKTYDQAYDEYNKKWADKPLPKTPSQVPDTPYLRIR